MAEDGKVIFTVGLDDSNVASEGEAAGRKAGEGVERGAAPGTNSFQEMMIGAARRIGEAFLDMAAKAVQGVEQIVQAGVEFNAKMEQYQVGFTTLLGSEEEAAKVMAQIREDAARTQENLNEQESRHHEIPPTCTNFLYLYQPSEF